MKAQRQCEIQSKTISTNPSIHAHYHSIIHSYHQYQSLLHYIISFISDLKLNIIQLKQSIYHLIGIKINPFKGQDNTFIHNCQQCQVQYMMNTCRKTRDDIIRITSLVKGYIPNRNIITRITPKVQTDKYWDNNHKQKLNFKTFENFNIKNGFHDQQEIKQQSTPEKQQLNTNDIGFITFRQNLISEKTQTKIKKSANNLIQQQNQQSSNCSICYKQNSNHPKKTTKQYHKLQQNDQFKKAFNLINIMKCQFNCPQHQPLDKKKYVSTSDPSI